MADPDDVRPEPLTLWWEATWDKRLFTAIGCLFACALFGGLGEHLAKGHSLPVQYVIWGAFSAMPIIPAVAWLARDALRFQSWRSELPFAVRGWSRLATAKDFGKKEYWWPAELAFECGNPAELARHFEAFRQAAQKAGSYPTDDTTSDARRPWRLEGTTAMGTINSGVAFALVGWLRGLAPAARELQLASVELRLTGEPRYLSHDSD